MSCLEEKSEGSSLIVRSAVMQQGSEMVINVLFFPPFFSRGSFCTGVLKKKAVPRVEHRILQSNQCPPFVFSHPHPETPQKNTQLCRTLIFRYLKMHELIEIRIYMIISMHAVWCDREQGGVRVIDAHMWHSQRVFVTTTTPPPSMITNPGMTAHWHS